MIYSTLFQTNLFEAIGWSLIHSIWEISLLVFILFLLIKTGILQKAKNIYLAAILALLSMLIVFIMGIFLYFDASGTASTSFQSSNSFPLLWEGQLPVTAHFNIFLEWLDKHIIQLSFIWISGLMIYAFRLTGALIYLTRIKKTAAPLQDSYVLKIFQGILDHTHYSAPVLISITDKIISPITFGIFKATIILPLAHINQLSPAEIESILAHELAHIIRKDYLMNMLVTLVKAMFYFHPGVWWIVQLIESEREKCTDELALKICSNDPVIYAKTLLNVQEMQLSLEQTNKSLISPNRNLVALPFFKNKKQLLSRIENILGKTERKMNVPGFIILILSTIGLLILFSFSDMIVPEKSKHPALAYINQEAEFKNKNHNETEDLMDCLDFIDEPIIKKFKNKKHRTKNIQQPFSHKKETSHFNKHSKKHWINQPLISDDSVRICIRMENPLEGPEMEIRSIIESSISIDSVEINMITEFAEKEKQLNEVWFIERFKLQNEAMELLAQFQFFDNELDAFVNKFNQEKQNAFKNLANKKAIHPKDRILKLKENILMPIENKTKKWIRVPEEIHCELETSNLSSKESITKIVVINKAATGQLSRPQGLRQTFVITGS
jgi:beta-lactamase regulating signal transducer with metallopeptidase domain